MKYAEQTQMLQYIIRGSKGTTFICQNHKKWNQIPYNSQDITRAIAEDRWVPYSTEETFVSMQSFRAGAKKRTTTYLEELRTVYLDIDYYNVNKLKNLPAQAVAAKIQKVLQKKKISVPSMIIDSGHGLYLIWLIDIHTASWLPVWQFIMRQFHRCLADFGADAKSLDCSRVLRLPGTVNKKQGDTGVSVCGINIPQNPVIYSFEELYNQAVSLHQGNGPIPEFAPVKKPARKKKKRTQKKSELINPSQSYFQASSRSQQIQIDRIYDLQLLLRLRQEKAVGSRELTFFYLNVALRRARFSDKERLRMLQQINRELPKPLPVKELLNVVKSWTAYMPSNKVIIDQLRITPDEQKHMRTIFGAEEKARRRTLSNLHQVSREERSRQCAKIIAELMLKSLSTQRIAEELQVSRQTVYNYKKRYGLIDIQSAHRFLATTRLHKTPRKKNRRKSSKYAARLHAISSTLQSIYHSCYKQLEFELTNNDASSFVKNLFDIAKRQQPKDDAKHISPQIPPNLKLTQPLPVKDWCDSYKYVPIEAQGEAIGRELPRIECVQRIEELTSILDLVCNFFCANESLKIREKRGMINT